MGDRLSNLPDEILCHILSSLPAEDVLATSLACRTMIPLWLSVPSLDFDEERSTTLVRSPSSFIQFINAALLQRGSHQPIKTLRLKGKYSTVTSHVKTWLNATTLPNVENLEIDCYTTVYLNLPCSIFSCTTLVVLKLFVTTFMEDFSSVNLPSLKALHLITVKFFKPLHLTELLNGCLNLENLEAKRIRFEEFDVKERNGSFKGKVKTLSKLVRADVSCSIVKTQPPVHLFPIDEFLRLEEFSDPVFPNLIHMELTLRGIHLQWKSVLNLLHHSPQLQIFVLHDLMTASCYDDWPNTPPRVPECFSSQLRTCLLTKFKGSKSEMGFSKFVLQNSTLLGNMTIFCYSRLSRDEKEKAELRIELDSCPRSSATCKLLLK